MTVSVVIPHFYAAREPNLPALVTRLLTGTVRPEEILIWNNDAPLRVRLPAPVAVIQSPRNLGCQARFLAALVARGDAVVFQDNDVMVRPRTLAALVRWATRAPRAIWTLDGRAATAEPYRRWHKIRRITGAPQRVTVSLGRLELVTRATVREILAVFPFGEGAAMDDLAFSACARQRDIPIYVPPTEPDEHLDRLPEHGVGACRTDGHYDRRDAIARQAFPDVHAGERPDGAHDTAR